MFPLLTLLFAIGLIPIQGHDQAEYDEWLLRWEISYHADGPYAHEMLQERADFLHRHPNGPTVPPAPQPASRSASQPASHSSSPIKVSAGTEQWRPLVSAYFALGDVDRVLCLMGHESGGDPTAVNPSSGAAGLMQIMPSVWSKKYPGDLFDPEYNIYAARGVYQEQGWGAWSPYNRGLCHS